MGVWARWQTGNQGGHCCESTGCLYVSDEPLNYNPETNIALCSLTRIEIEIWKEKKKRKKFRQEIEKTGKLSRLDLGRRNEKRGRKEVPMEAS